MWGNVGWFCGGLATASFVWLVAVYWWLKEVWRDF